jgi:tRNA A-37 threonylcarbamoyl transferase component Bud32
MKHRNKKLRGFKGRFLKNLKRVSPRIKFRVITSLIFLSPGLMLSLIKSWKKMSKWRKVETCKNFIKWHQLAFEDVSASSLVVESHPGGVSNAVQIWRFKKRSGEEVEYFVKVFVSAGTYWAKYLWWASPFPPIYGGEIHERFTVDLVTRSQLQEKGIPVPKLVAYDTVQKVVVTERIEGENVDGILQRIASEKSIRESDAEAIRQCGMTLAKIHKAGFSLIDTQPANCIWQEKEEKIYFTDFEFCTQQDRRVWDVGFFLSYIVARIPNHFRTIIRNLFLESYRAEKKLDVAGVAETRRQMKEYIPIIQTILDIRQFTPEELLEEIVRID